jgi:hypothetical protein
VLAGRQIIFGAQTAGSPFNAQVGDLTLRLDVLVLKLLQPPHPRHARAPNFFFHRQNACSGTARRLQISAIVCPVDN